MSQAKAAALWRKALKSVIFFDMPNVRLRADRRTLPVINHARYGYCIRPRRIADSRRNPTSVQEIIGREMTPEERKEFFLPLDAPTEPSPHKA